LKVYARGVLEDIDPQRAFCQLACPDPSNPVCILGMELGGVVTKQKFGASPELLTHNTLHNDNERTVYNLTPRYARVGLHIGIDPRAPVGVLNAP
jgi:hypothetical protein